MRGGKETVGAWPNGRLDYGGAAVAATLGAIPPDDDELWSRDRGDEVVSDKKTDAVEYPTRVEGAVAVGGGGVYAVDLAFELVEAVAEPRKEAAKPGIVHPWKGWW